MWALKHVYLGYHKGIIGLLKALSLQEKQLNIMSSKA